MAITLTLAMTADQQVLSHLGDPSQPLAPPTPLSTLTRIEGTSNPYQFDPFGLGLQLFQALGGQNLLEQLNRDSDNLLLLVVDEQTAAIPWEYAATPEQSFLVLRYGFLRLLPEVLPLNVTTNGPLNLIVLAADPLVDQQGRPILARTRFNPNPGADETAPRLDLKTELAAIQQVLHDSGRTLAAQRIPPTKAALQRALRGAPAMLHLSCHGTVIKQQDGRLQPLLFLEDENGQMAPLRGDELIDLARHEL
jgi:hypothetical protein